MKIWSAQALSEALSTKTKASGNVVHFNSSDLGKDDVFIALGSGHNYIKDAIKNGASCIIAEKITEDIDHNKVILVPNTKDALLAMARYKRSKSKAKFIGITGSAGKTSTKDAMYHALKSFGKTFASRGTFNNDLGVPLNLASLPDDIEYAILEMGMNHKGEIRPLAKLVKPDIGIIINVLAVHMWDFNSTKEIADEKCEIFSSMDENGIAILNYDNPHYEYCKQKAKVKNIYSFGSNEGADIRFTSYESDGFESKLQFTIKNEAINIITKITGKHRASNIGAILLTLHILGLDLKRAAVTFKDLSSLEGRGQRIKAQLNTHECLLINDCYNAAPSAMQNSLIEVGEISHPNKIAILANMTELGPNEIEYHKELADFVLGAGIKHLYTVGSLMLHLHNELKNKIDCKHFESTDDLKQEVIGLIKTPSLILLKGSKSMGLSSLVEFLISKNSINHVV